MLAEEFGVTTAEAVQARLADLTAAPTINDLPSPPSPAASGNPEEVQIEAGTSNFIVFKANHSKIARLPSGETNWSRVTRIKIIRIEGKN